MYKYTIINFIMKAMEKWKVELGAGWQTLAEEKNPRKNLSVKLSPLFVIVKM